MEYDYPIYIFPQDIPTAIKDGREMATELLNNRDNITNQLNRPIALGVCFTQWMGKKSRLLDHFRRSKINDNRLVVTDESGYKAARAVLTQTIILDSCTWSIAQEIQRLSPEDLKTIQNGYTKIHKAMALPIYDKEIPRWVRTFNVAIKRYNPNYCGDKKIKALFRIPGMLSPGEDPHECEQALSVICAPNLNQ